MEFGTWFLWLFGGLLGRREIVVFLRTKSFLFQDFNLYFLMLLYSWSVGLSGDKELNFLAFIDCIMDESLGA